jgi:release factor glutamine methyltransferase
MDQVMSADRGLERELEAPQQSPPRRLLRNTIHFFSYHLVMRRRSTWRTRAAGLRLNVHPTVFHPRYFLSSGRFAGFIGELDLRGKR